eukprot:XP_011433961.1 PREDICTED: uncharacterized protein LOC105332919 [Crassostrea gigas]
MKHQRLHASCSNGDPMIQISGYNHPYFDIDSLEHVESMEESIIGIKESIENSAIFCMWKNQCKIDKTTRKDIFKTEEWFKKNMRCLKNGTKVYDLISNATNSGDSELENFSGTIIVRSHEYFPWNYRFCDDIRKFVLRFITGETHVEKFKVALQIVFSEIHSKFDSLFLVQGKRTVNIVQGSGIVELDVTELKHVEVELKSTRPLTSPKCWDSAKKGFLLCLRLVEKTQEIRTICEDVMYDVTVETREHTEQMQYEEITLLNMTNCDENEQVDFEESTEDQHFATSFVCTSQVTTGISVSTSKSESSLSTKSEIIEQNKAFNVKDDVYFEKYTENYHSNTSNVYTPQKTTLLEKLTKGHHLTTSTASIPRVTTNITVSFSKSESTPSANSANYVSQPYLWRPHLRIDTLLMSTSGTLLLTFVHLY